MPRNSERSFCCGAGGARMWMEEKTGERINLNRTTEAVATGADQIAVGCPFCRVMLSDGLTSLQADGKAREEVEVLDVAQMLLASVKRADGARDRRHPARRGGSTAEEPRRSRSPLGASPTDPTAGSPRWRRRRARAATSTQTEETVTRPARTVGRGRRGGASDPGASTPRARLRGRTRPESRPRGRTSPHGPTRSTARSDTARSAPAPQCTPLVTTT